MKNRFSKFSKVEAMTMDEFWNKHIDFLEKQRLSQIEIFDEVEEWVLMGQHYCISFACKNMNIDLLE